METKKDETALSKNVVDGVREAIKKNNLIPAGSVVIAGVSGGPDSVCLLHVLSILKHELGIRIEAVHINHMLRGKESDGDEEYVRQLCGKLEVPVHIEKCDIVKIAAERGMSIEEAGRDVRYETFRKVAKQTGADSICVAHNMNDQAETVLMNILRGSGLEGLKGMEYRNGSIVRPLLEISRSRIEQYCIKEELKPRIDSSNLETQYTRNIIRLKLLPYIKGLMNTAPETALSKMASILSADNEYLEKCADEAFGAVLTDEDPTALTLDAKALAAMHEAISSRVIRKCILRTAGTLKGIGREHITAVKELAGSGRTGALICLPLGVRVAKSYDTVQLFLKENRMMMPPVDISITIPGETEIPGRGITVNTSVLEPGNAADEIFAKRDSLVQYFDYEAAEKGIRIRNRRDGDRIKPLGFSGTKKLKSYFIDKKIPRTQRDGILLLAADNDIIWIIGHEKGDKYKVTENTAKVLAVEVKPKGEKPL